MKRFIDFLKSEVAHVKEIRKLSEGDIVHFKHIRISKKKLQDLRDKIEKLNEDIERVNSIKIWKLLKHYYIPLLVTEDKMATYVEHIIRHSSEVNFLEKLERNMNILFREFDWWYFSKIDETLDNIYIPYYDNGIRKFYPDFIFWLKKNDNYIILFIDPKTVSFSDAMKKIDGYRRLFECNGKPKLFKYENLNVIVLLYMYNPNSEMVPDKYINYWIDSIQALSEKVSNFISNLSITTEIQPVSTTMKV